MLGGRLGNCCPPRISFNQSGLSFIRISPWGPRTAGDALRSGRLYCTLRGHVKPVLGVSFSPNGHLVATGSQDNFCRIWDLRTTRMLYSIPAHNNLISRVKFEPEEGYYLATSSYDTKATLWSTRDYKPIKSLADHESKVTSLDISGDGQKIVTVSHDRNYKDVVM